MRSQWRKNKTDSYCMRSSLLNLNDKCEGTSTLWRKYTHLISGSCTADESRLLQPVLGLRAFLCVCVYSPQLGSDDGMLASQDAWAFKPLYLTSCETAKWCGTGFVGHRWCDGWMDGWGLDGDEAVGWGVQDSQAGSPPAVPQQSRLCWDGDVAKNNISQQQQGSFHSHHSSGSLWAESNCPKADGGPDRLPQPPNTHTIHTHSHTPTL